MEGDVFALAVAGGEDHEHCGDAPGNDAHADEHAAVMLMRAATADKTRRPRHDEARGHHGADHVVQVLPEGPRVGEERRRSW